MKVISGGQTGADQGGLFGAQDANVATGGMAPKGYRTQAGPMPKLLQSFGLIESYSSAYPPRTEWNVKNSDGTVLFGRTESPGCRLTIRLCSKHRKPYIVNPTVDDLRRWIERHNVQTMNVAGNREETNPGIFDRTRECVREAVR